MNRRLWRQTAGSVGILAVGLACWVVAGLAADRLARKEMESALAAQRQMARAIVGNMAEVIASDLSMSRAIPATMAETAVVQQALAQAANYAVNGHATEQARRAALLKAPELVDANSLLHDAQGFSGLDAIWLVNTHGVCIASSNARDSLSYVGIDMRTRPYLADTLLGGFAQMYGVGQATGDPGIFVAAPVYRDGLLVGAIAARVGIARLRHWVAHPGTFVTDGNGVIIMAHDSALEGHTLPDSPIRQMTPAARLGSYLRDRFPEIPLEPAAASVRRQAPWFPRAEAASLLTLPDEPAPALHESQGGLNSGLSAHLIDPLSAWSDLLANQRRNRLLIFVTLAGSATLAGVITLSWVRERRLHRATRGLADQLQAANALLSAEARDDALTGALSRRYFIDLLRHEIDRAYETGTPLCLAIADLDHFKQINDRFGHPAGDLALQHFVDICRAELRTDDAVGRLGGEEFGILLPATPLATGLTVAERLCAEVRSYRSAELPADVRLTVSVGISELAANHDQLERLMSRADFGLYTAKSAGRDRCAAVSPDDPVPPYMPERTW
ncbi:MAG TPA: diguanylate cyclase [Paraburkholderia sp.]|jgi:diguanylate cyclase (GGDEF)-like protein|nr:diguanylate cyclase [Paraburkholderia sp.]